MNKFRFVTETPDHFVLHNSKAHFHIAKNGIDTATADRIRALANGGKATAGNITQSENKKNMAKIDANIAAAKNYSNGGQAQSPEEAGIEAEEKAKRAQSKQSPEEKQVESQAKQQDPMDYVKYNNPDKFADGGEATNEDPVQSFQDSFRKATHYDEGGLVDVSKVIKEAFEGPTPAPTPDSQEEKYRKIREQNQKNMSGGSNYAGGGPVASNAVKDISHETQAQAIGRYAAGEPANLAKGGYAKSMSEGKYHFHFYDGAIVPTQLDKEMGAGPQQPSALDRYVGGEPVNLADGGDPSDSDKLAATAQQLQSGLSAQEAPAPEDQPSPNPTTADLLAAAGDPNKLGTASDQPAASPDQASAPGAVPPSQQISAAPSKSATQSSIPDKSDMLGQLNADIKGEQDAILGGKDAEAKGFAAQAKALQDNLTVQQNANQAYQKEVDQITKQNTDLFNNVRNNVINPNHFWENKSTGGKVMAGIALLLGGASSGLTGKSNPALDVIQKSIQDDIEAQKANQSQGVNLYKLGLEKYRDAQSAHQYATLQANALLQGQLSKIAAQTGNQTAQFQAQQAIHQLGLQNAELRSNLGLRQAAVNSMNAQPTNKGGIDLNKSRLLTMAGVIPKEEQTNVDKESDDYQKLSQTLDHTDQVFKQAADNANYTQRIANALPLGSHIPTTRDSTKDYQAITDAWLGNITKDTEGRVTPTDVDLMRKSLPIAGDPPAVIQAKLNNIKDMIRQKYSFNTLKKYTLIPNNDAVSTSNATRQKRFKEGPAR